MLPFVNQVFIQQVIDLAVQAGLEILSVYTARDELAVDTKADMTPVTEADRRAHTCIRDGLLALTPAIPILSEEAEHPSFEERRQWPVYWLVDPLDGTKEFISGNGEFTVNIALIESGQPVLGVVHVPVTRATYSGGKDLGTQLVSASGVSHTLAVRSLPHRLASGLPVEIVASRRHGAAKVAALQDLIHSTLGPVSCVSIGSSLKLCLVAAGEADLYPRLGPTSEWDTAAAQAVVEGAGGYVIDEQGHPLKYNQKDSLLNPNFYVLGDSYDLLQPLLTRLT